MQFQLTDITNKKVIAWSNITFSPKNTLYSTKKLNIQLGKNYQIKKTNGYYHLFAKLKEKGQPAITLNLKLMPERSPLLINKTGLLPMGNNTNSYYYSITRLSTSGTLSIQGKVFHFHKATSSSWMDHQWGDFVITHQNQWIWMGIRLNNDTDINIVTAVDPKTQQLLGGIANLLLPNGKTLYTTDFQLTPVPPKKNEGKYPLQYGLEIPIVKLKMTITSLAPNQDKNGFWEGISDVTANQDGKPVSGFAYTENTIR